MKKIRIGVFVLLFLFMLPVFALPAQAGVNLGLNYADGVGLGNEDPRVMIQGIVRVIMTFLAIIAVVIILLGGFKWMTAAGNEDKVGEAKKLLVAGIIGLAIILAAWGIAYFVIDQMIDVSNST